MNKWIYYLVLFHVNIIVSDASTFGQLNILHSPRSIAFGPCDSVKEANIKEMYSAVLGLTHNESAEFFGFTILDPFDTPEAIVEISIVGYYTINFGSNPTIKYKVEMCDSDPDTVYDITRRITSYQGYDLPTIVVVALHEEKQSHENSNMFSDLNVKQPSTQPLRHLKYTTMEDYEFLMEMELINLLTNKIKSQVLGENGYLDFYEVYVSSFNDLVKIYGLQSHKVQEAITILNNTILDLKNAFVNGYKDSVLITILSAEEIKHRVDYEKNVGLFEQMNLRWRARRLNDEVSTETDDPALFNLIFWFTLGYIYALAIVVNAIFSTKPDTNSIIYRLSMQRPRAEH